MQTAADFLNQTQAAPEGAATPLNVRNIKLIGSGVYCDGIHFAKIEPMGFVHDGKILESFGVYLYYPGQLYSDPSMVKYFDSMQYALACCEVFAEVEYKNYRRDNR
jgi:hypothetical protein